jgi:hypothetical protein
MNNITPTLPIEKLLVEHALIHTMWNHSQLTTFATVATQSTLVELSVYKFKKFPG